MLEVNPIYRRYQNYSQSLDVTLNLIEELLTERLNNNTRRILVYGTNSGKVRFCIIVFPNDNIYSINFHSMNIRQWRPSNSDEQLQVEINNIERIIEELRNKILSNFIN